MKKIQSLNAVRGIACLIVMFAHWGITVSGVGMYCSGVGKIGAWSFMVMTGFFNAPIVK